MALGLGSVVVGAFDDARVASVAGLKPDERPLTILPVGRARWPAARETQKNVNSAPPD